MVKLVVLGSKGCDACRRAEDTIKRMFNDENEDGEDGDDNVDVRVVSPDSATREEKKRMAKEGNLWLPTICREGDGLEECIRGYSEEEFEKQLTDLIDDGGM